MRLYSFDFSKGRRIEAYDSSGVVISGLVSDPRTGLIAAISLEPEGVLGAHKAAEDQLFVVLQGYGKVSGEDVHGVEVTPGSAIFWRKGEMHGVRAGAEGLTAIVVEGERVSRSITMTPRRFKT